MELNHTPAPWDVVRINEKGQSTPDGKNWWVYAGNGNGWVGDSYMSACLGSENDAEANARLIAAAPDLLEALREARDTLHQHYVDWDGEPEDAVPLQLARAKCEAAIAKATQP